LNKLSKSIAAVSLVSVSQTCSRDNTATMDEVAGAKNYGQ